jgi:hypoxanthine phosphoribosyltransferase
MSSGKYVERVLIEAETIQKKIKELGVKISKDYAGEDLVLICVLKGAVVFLSDLMRSLDIPVEIDFMAVSSYGAATESSGVVRILKDLERSIEGRHCLIVEDIIDTGLTLKYMKEYLLSQLPASLKVVALLDKPQRRKVDIAPDYCGFKIPDEFVVGFGLDFNERFRSLPGVCVLGDKL